MRGIEKGGEVWPARTPAAALLGLGSARARERRRRRKGKRSWVPGGDKLEPARVQARWLTRGGARRLPQSSVWAARSTETTVNDFEQILTIQNSEFHIGT